MSVGSRSPRRANGRTASGRVLAAVWLILAVGLGGLLLLAGLAEGPLDDADQARQRPGVLDLAPLPVPAVPVTDSIPRGGRAAVVFFTRSERLDELCAAVRAAELDADVAIVTPAAGATCGAAAVVADPALRLAAAYQLRQPDSGGPPLGYAVVDTQRRIRYATLDPTTAEHLFEVRTMLAAL